MKRNHIQIQHQAAEEDLIKQKQKLEQEVEALHSHIQVGAATKIVSVSKVKFVCVAGG